MSYMDPTDPATLERLKAISIDDVELSVRSLNALKKCGVRTLHEAQTAVSNGQLPQTARRGPQDRQRSQGDHLVRDAPHAAFAQSSEPPEPR